MTMFSQPNNPMAGTQAIQALLQRMGELHGRLSTIGVSFDRLRDNLQRMAELSARVNAAMIMLVGLPRVFRSDLYHMVGYAAGHAAYTGGVGGMARAGNAAGRIYSAGSAASRDPKRELLEYHALKQTLKQHEQAQDEAYWNRVRSESEKQKQAEEQLQARKRQQEEQYWASVKRQRDQEHKVKESQDRAHHARRMREIAEQGRLRRAQEILYSKLVANLKELHAGPQKQESHAQKAGDQARKRQEIEAEIKKIQDDRDGKSAAAEEKKTKKRKEGPEGHPRSVEQMRKLLDTKESDLKFLNEKLQTFSSKALSGKLSKKEQKEWSRTFDLAAKTEDEIKGIQGALAALPRTHAQPGPNTGPQPPLKPQSVFAGLSDTQLQKSYERLNRRISAATRLKGMLGPNFDPKEQERLNRMLLGRDAFDFEMQARAGTLPGSFGPEPQGPSLAGRVAGPASSVRGINTKLHARNQWREAAGSGGVFGQGLAILHDGFRKARVGAMEFFHANVKASKSPFMRDLNKGFFNLFRGGNIGQTLGLFQSTLGKAALPTMYAGGAVSSILQAGAPGAFDTVINSVKLLAAALAGALIPGALQLAFSIQQLAFWIHNANPEMKEWLGFLVKAGLSLGGIMVAASLLAGVLNALATVSIAVKTAFSFLSVKIGTSGMAIGAGVGIAVAALAAWAMNLHQAMQEQKAAQEDLKHAQGEGEKGVNISRDTQARVEEIMKLKDEKEREKKLRELEASLTGESIMAGAVNQGMQELKDSGPLGWFVHHAASSMSATPLIGPSMVSGIEGVVGDPNDPRHKYVSQGMGPSQMQAAALKDQAQAERDRYFVQSVIKDPSKAKTQDSAMSQMLLSLTSMKGQAQFSSVEDAYKRVQIGALGDDPLQQLLHTWQIQNEHQMGQQAATLGSIDSGIKEMNGNFKK